MQKSGRIICGFVDLRLTGLLCFLVLFFFQIAHFKIPRYIKFVDEFPLTVTGKVRK